MLRPKNQERFNQHVKDLILYLRSLFKEEPNLKTLTGLILTKHRTMDNEEYIRAVIKSLEPHFEMISQNNEFVFTPEYGKRPLFFLYGLDFRKFWHLVKSGEDKRIIFRFLQLLFIQGSTAIGENRDKVTALAECIKVSDEISKEAHDNPKQFDDDKFKSLFGDDDVIYDLAQDLSHEFDLGSMLQGMINPEDIQKMLSSGGNPAEMIKSMQDNPKMRESMTKVAERAKARMDEKNITQEDLMKSFSKMKDNLSKNVKGPMGAQIKKMMQQFDISKMGEQLKNFQPPTNASDTTASETITNTTTNTTTTNTTTNTTTEPQPQENFTPYDQNEMFKKLMENFQLGQTPREENFPNSTQNTTQTKDTSMESVD